MVTLGYESPQTTGKDVSTLSKGLDHSIDMAFNTYCNKYKIAKKNKREFGNTHRKIVDEQDWGFELVKGYEDEADMMMTVVDFSKIDSSLDDVNMLLQLQSSDLSTCSSQGTFTCNEI